MKNVIKITSIILLLAFISCEDPRSENQKFVEDVIMDSFGKNSHFVNAVKEELNDPNSFEHINTTVSGNETTDYFIVEMEYTAKNGFGGRVKSTALAHFYKSGKLEILEIK